MKTELISHGDAPRFRKLSFELMEPRLSLSGLPLVESSEALLDEFQRLLDHGESPEAILDTIEQWKDIGTSLEHPPAITPAAVPALSDAPIVEISTIALNQDGEIVTEFSLGQRYTLRVFVQDMRSGAVHSDSRHGIFRASVDLHFGDGIVPTGTPSFSNEFQSLKTYGTERIGPAGRVLENVGAVRGSWDPFPEWTGEPEWLFDASFLVETEVTEASILAVPARDPIDSILVFGENLAIDPTDVSTSQLQIPVIQSLEPPPSTEPLRIASLPIPNGFPQAQETGVFVSSVTNWRAVPLQILSQPDAFFGQDEAIMQLSDRHAPLLLDPYTELLDRLRADIENDEDDGLITLEFPSESRVHVAEELRNDPVAEKADSESEDRVADEEIDLGEMWGIADLLTEDGTLEPTLGKYRMKFRIFSLLFEQSKHPSEQSTLNHGNQAMIDLTQLIRPKNGIDAAFRAPDDKRVVRELRFRGSRAAAITFDLDALFADKRDTQIDFDVNSRPGGKAKSFQGPSTQEATKSK